MSASSSSSWSDEKKLTPTASKRNGIAVVCVKAVGVSPTITSSHGAGHGCSRGESRHMESSKVESIWPYMIGKSEAVGGVNVKSGAGAANVRKTSLSALLRVSR